MGQPTPTPYPVAFIAVFRRRVNASFASSQQSLELFLHKVATKSALMARSLHKATWKVAFLVPILLDDLGDLSGISNSVMEALF